MNATPTNSRLLPMNQGAFTSNTTAIPILGSGGAADCVIIAAYSPSSRRSFLIHATRQTPLSQVRDLILRHLTTPLDVYLSSTAVTEQPNSTLLIGARTLFNQQLNVTVTEYATGKLALDATTGEVTDQPVLGQFGMTDAPKEEKTTITNNNNNNATSTASGGGIEIKSDIGGVPLSPTHGATSGTSKQENPTKKFAVVDIPSWKPSGEKKSNAAVSSSLQEMMGTVGLRIDYFDGEIEKAERQHEAQRSKQSSDLYVGPTLKRTSSFGSSKK